MFNHFLSSMLYWLGKIKYLLFQVSTKVSKARFSRSESEKSFTKHPKRRASDIKSGADFTTAKNSDQKSSSFPSFSGSTVLFVRKATFSCDKNGILIVKIISSCEGNNLVYKRS